MGLAEACSIVQIIVKLYMYFKSVLQLVLSLNNTSGGHQYRMLAVSPGGAKEGSQVSSEGYLQQ